MARDRGLHWFVAMTEPHGERLAERHLSTARFASFLPMCSEKLPCGRFTQWRHGPLFPGYIFIRFDPDVSPWGAINALPGIMRSVGVLRLDGRPMPVPEGVIADIQARLAAANGVIKVMSPDELAVFAENQRLRVTAGPLEGREGLYAGRSAERIALLLDILGREVEVELDPKAVALV